MINFFFFAFPKSSMEKNHKQELQEIIRKFQLGISFPLLNIFADKYLSKDLLKVKL